MTEIVKEEVKVTFIIPTIGRSSLRDTLLSLMNQTNSQWNAIVVFDNIEPDENIVNDFSDNRIKIMKSNKLGEGKNSAGNVRNYGIKYATTPWIAFLDDDDSLKNTYVDIFLSEISHNVDAIIFRMLNKKKNLIKILPLNNCDNFYFRQVGISFALKKSIFDSGIIFEPSNKEDFELLKKIRENKYKMMISPHLLYYVRNYDNHIECNDLNRVFIN